jgi:LPXTG-motif cell wall-anchored protein
MHRLSLSSVPFLTYKDFTSFNTGGTMNNWPVIFAVWLFMAGISLGGLFFKVHRNITGNRILTHSRY